MVSYGDVRKWQPAPLENAGNQSKARCQQLLGLADELAGSGAPEGWSGGGAEAAAGKRNQLSDRMEQVVASVSAIQRGLFEAADAVTGLQRAIGEVDGLAKAHNLEVSDAGGVIDPGLSPDTPPDQADAVKAEREKVKAELLDRVHQILARAEETDRDLAALMGRAEHGEIGDGGATSLTAAAQAGAEQGGLSVLDPPKNGSPEDVHAWWETLSDEECHHAARENPELIGGLDGVPAAGRDEANRIVLDAQMGQLEHEKMALQAKGDDLSEDERERLQQITEKLGHPESVTEPASGIHALQDRLAHPVGGQRAYLLGLDSANQGKAIVAMGNPDTAANVSTYVPGTGSKLGGIAGDMNRADRMQATAEDRDPGKSTAVVAWMDYTAPPDVATAALPVFADEGAPALDSFQDGLRATHEGAPSNNSVVGHSYGSTLIGHAARDHGLNADDVAFVGSPGVGVDHADQLHLDGVPHDQVAKHVHSSTAQHDMIKATNMNPSHMSAPIGWFMPDVDPLGPDPIKSDFGGQTFTSGPGAPGPLETMGLSDKAHSQYWEPGSDGLKNMGNVITGKPTY